MKKHKYKFNDKIITTFNTVSCISRGEPASRPETRYRGKGSTPVKIFRYLGV